jgi:ABC-2 type transport system ATP-binding protein
MAESPMALRIQGLSKIFRVGFWNRPFTALERLDLEVRAGEVFGFLGPNGAGKTTAMKILMGLMRPTSGRAWILERDLGDVGVKREVGFLPEAPYFYDYLTAQEFLRFYGQLFGLERRVLAKRIEELLQRVGLSEAGHLQLRKFSKGMLQRIGIAQALINDPRLVILDEPMSGLDPIGRREIRDLILQLKQSGKTIFFSSHILHDAELLCDRVGILVKGRLVALGPVHELVGAASTQSVEVVVQGLDAEGLAQLEPMAHKVMAQDERTLFIVKNQAVANEVLDVARKRKATVISLSPQKGSLEDLFVREVEGRHPEDLPR